MKIDHDPFRQSLNQQAEAAVERRDWGRGGVQAVAMPRFTYQRIPVVIIARDKETGESREFDEFDFAGMKRWEREQLERESAA